MTPDMLMAGDSALIAMAAFSLTLIALAAMWRP